MLSRLRPKLINDSKREFTDLKMAWDHFMSPHTEQSEHHNKCSWNTLSLKKHATLLKVVVITRNYIEPLCWPCNGTVDNHTSLSKVRLCPFWIHLIKAGESKSFKNFALWPVGMLSSTEGPNGLDLMSTGHVDRLLSTLPQHLRDNFIKHLNLQTHGQL